MPPKKNMKPVQKPANTGKTIKRIFSYMYGFKLHFAFVAQTEERSAVSCRENTVFQLIRNCIGEVKQTQTVCYCRSAFSDLL